MKLGSQVHLFPLISILFNLQFLPPSTSDPSFSLPFLSVFPSLFPVLPPSLAMLSVSSPSLSFPLPLSLSPSCFFRSLYVKVVNDLLSRVSLALIQVLLTKELPISRHYLFAFLLFDNRKPLNAHLPFCSSAVGDEHRFETMCFQV